MLNVGQKIEDIDFTMKNMKCEYRSISVSAVITISDFTQTHSNLACKTLKRCLVYNLFLGVGGAVEKFRDYPHTYSQMFMYPLM